MNNEQVNYASPEIQEIQNLLTTMSQIELQTLLRALQPAQKNNYTNTLELDIPNLDLFTAKPSNWGAFKKDYLYYIEKNFSESYLHSIGSAIKHLESYYGNEFDLNEISAQKAELFMTHMQKHAPKGRRVYLRNLKAMFNKAKAWKIISSNPFESIKLQKEQIVKPQIITMQELDKMLKYVNSESLRAFYQFALLTGCRRSEILNLTWDMVDFEKNTITIGSNSFRTKSGKQRILPMPRKVKYILLQLQAKVLESKQAETGTTKKPVIRTNYVFCNKAGQKFGKDYVSQCFKKAALNAKCNRELHLHCCRHSYASLLVQNGIPLYTVMNLLGHSELKTTQRYSQLDMQSMQNAVYVLDKVLDNYVTIEN